MSIDKKKNGTDAVAAAFSKEVPIRELADPKLSAPLPSHITRGLTYP